jgi:hypothetical protein
LALILSQRLLLCGLTFFITLQLADRMQGRAFLEAPVQLWQLPILLFLNCSTLQLRFRC